MVEKIKETKDKVLRRMEQAIDERGMERADVNELGKLADIVKDMAEAEKSCWEAEYYRSVSEAMEDGSMGYEDGMGYAQDGQGGSQGYRQGGQGYRRGYAQGGQGGQGYRRGYNQSRDSQGRYTSRRGYREGYGHSDMMQEVRQMMETADPQEREQLKMQLRQMTEM